MLQRTLLREDVLYEIDGLDDGEHLIFGHKLSLLQHLDVQDVVNEADEQVNLRDDNDYDLSLRLVHHGPQQALQEHQG